MHNQHSQDLSQKLLLNVPESVEYSGINRSALYRMIRAGHLRTVKISKKATRIRTSDLQELVEKLGSGLVL